MRAALPFILVVLALFSAICVAYVAWELTSEKPNDETPSDPD